MFYNISESFKQKQYSILLLFIHSCMHPFRQTFSTKPGVNKVYVNLLLFYAKRNGIPFYSLPYTAQISIKEASDIFKKCQKSTCDCFWTKLWYEAIKWLIQYKNLTGLDYSQVRNFWYNSNMKTVDAKHPVSQNKKCTCFLYRDLGIIIILLVVLLSEKLWTTFEYRFFFMFDCLTWVS